MQEFCRNLLGWKDCDQCANRGTCSSNECPRWRCRGFKAFFQFYKLSTSFYTSQNIVGGLYALRNHEDLFSIIRLLKENPDAPRSVLTNEHFSKFGDIKPREKDQCRAFNLVGTVMTMVDCCCEKTAPKRATGPDPTVWHSNESLSQFMASAFPTEDPPDASGKHRSSDMRRLAVKRLKKDHGFQFRGTQNLSDHLYLELDGETRILYIFYHARALKEHLIATRDIWSSNYGSASASR